MSEHKTDFLYVSTKSIRNSKAIVKIGSGVGNKYKRTEYPTTDIKK